MVAVSFLVFAVSRADTYINSLLIQPFQAKFHASSASVLFCTVGVKTLLSGAGLPLGGMLMQRYSARTFMIAGMVSLAIGYVGLAYASHLWQVAAVYGIFIAAGVVTTSLAANLLISHWFDVRRGLAMGLATAGIGASGLILPSTIVFCIEHPGFYRTFLGLAVVAALVLPVIGWLVVDRPNKDFRHGEDVPQPTAMASEASASPKLWTFAQVFTCPRFWSIALITTIYNVAANAMFSNLVPLAQNAGVSPKDAPYLISSTAMGAVVGVVVSGKLFDSLSQRTMTRLFAVFLAAPCALFIGKPPCGMLMPAVAILGLCGGTASLLPAILCSANFGPRGFPIAYGAAAFFPVVFVVMGVSLFGHVYDIYGTFDRALVGLLVLLGAMFVAGNLMPAGKVCVRRGSAT